MKKRTRGNPIPLIVEPHPDDYDGYPFITLIQYHDQHLLAIVDNADDKSINAYVLDLCGPERINEQVLVETVASWWDERKDRYPVSIEFSRLNLTREYSKIYRTFQIEYVPRVIGPLPKFEMSEVQSVKRKKRKSVPEGVEIKKNIIYLHG